MAAAEQSHDLPSAVRRAAPRRAGAKSGPGVDSTDLAAPDVFKGLEQARAYHEASQQKAKLQPATKPGGKNAEPTGTRYLIDALGKLQDCLGKFLETIDSEPCLCDTSRFALLDGRAGSGKSHLIASEIERALTAGGASIFLLEPTSRRTKAPRRKSSHALKSMARAMPTDWQPAPRSEVEYKLA